MCGASRGPVRALSSHDRWPIAGRADELGRIGAAVAAGCGVVLTGERGAGRSRLLSVALGHVDGSQVWLAPFDLDGLPDEHVVVGIDDAETLTSECAARLHHLATAGRVSVVAAVHEGVWVPEGISRLWLDGLAERVEVRPFGHEQIAEVLRARLGGEVDTEAVRDLGMLTAGNAMLLRELTEHAVAEGSLRREGGTWRFHGLFCADGRIADVVRVRLGRLTGAEAELIDLVALAGTLCLDTLPGFEETAEALNRRGVLTVTSGLHVRFAFPLFDEVVAAAVPELTARRLHAKLAVAGQAEPPPPVRTLRPVRESRPLTCAAEPYALTTREREVATHAANDLTSKEIAELLVLSVRTVENHLQRAYHKLGITRRADLGAALAGAAPPAAAVPRQPRGTAS